MAFAFLVTLSMVGIPLLALVVLVGFIRRWQFSLKRLLGVAALFGVLMLPLVELERRTAGMPQPISLPFDGEDRWVTPPLADAEYWITLFYEPDKPGRLGEALMLRLFDDSDGTLVLSTGPNPYPIQISGGREGVVVCQFRAIEGHRYRIEVNEDQAKELARYHHPRLCVHLPPGESQGRLGIP